jgi:hypothetical protein
MRRLFGGIATAVSLGLGVTPALAAPVLSPTRVISPKPAPVAEPVLAVSDNGRALAAWDVVDETIRNEVETWHGPIQARLGRVGGRWGAVQTLSGWGHAPLAALGSDGTAALGWTAEERPGRSPLRLSIAPPGRPFGRSIGITTGRSFGVLDGVEVLPDDRVVVVWSRAVETEASTDRRLLSVIEYAVFEPSGHRQRSGVIAETSEGEEEPELVTVAQTSTGSLLVAFPPLSRESSTEQLAVLPAGASKFAPVQAIRAPGGRRFELRRARVSAGPGGAGLTMTLGKGDGLGFESRLLEPSEGGVVAPGVPIDISSGGPHEIGHSFEASLPKVAFSADGTRVAAWARSSWAEYHEGAGRLEEQVVMLTTAPPGASTFTTPVALSVGPGFAGEPSVASAGSATVVVWTQSRSQMGGAASCPKQVYAVVRAQDGSLSPGRPLSPALSGNRRTYPGGPPDGCEVQLVVAGSSRYALVGWIQHSTLHVATLTG